MAMFWTEVPIAIIVVAFRIYSRYKIKATGLDDWIMIATLVSLAHHPSYRISKRLLDSIYSSRHSCNIYGPPRRSSPSLLFGPCPGRVCNQSRLDLSAVQYHVSRNRQDICCSTIVKTPWTLHILVEMVPLH